MTSLSPLLNITSIPAVAAGVLPPVASSSHSDERVAPAAEVPVIGGAENARSTVTKASPQTAERSATGNSQPATVADPLLRHYLPTTAATVPPSDISTKTASPSSNKKGESEMLAQGKQKPNSKAASSTAARSGVPIYAASPVKSLNKKKAPSKKKPPPVGSSAASKNQNQAKPRGRKKAPPGVSPTSRPLKKTRPCSTSTKAKKAAPSRQNRKQMPHSAAVFSDNIDPAIVERYLFQTNQRFQDGLMNEYLDRKYEEFVLNRPPAGLPGIPSTTDDGTMIKMSEIAEQQEIDDFFAGENLALREQSCEPSFFAHDAPFEQSHTSPSPPSVAVGSDETSPSDSKESCSPPSPDATSIETIEKGALDDCTPIDLTRANSDDLYKTLLGMSSRSASSVFNATEGGYPSRFADSIQATSTGSIDPSMLTRVSPDATQHFQLHSQLEQDYAGPNHQYPPTTDTAFSPVGGGTPGAYLNTISPESGAVPINMHGDDQDTSKAGLSSEQAPRGIPDDLMLFQYLENPNAHEGNYLHGSTDLALGQYQGRNFQDAESFHWDELEQDHRVLGNGGYCPYTQQEHLIARNSSHHQPARLPKRVSFVSAEVKSPPAVDSLGAAAGPSFASEALDYGLGVSPYTHHAAKETEENVKVKPAIKKKLNIKSTSDPQSSEASSKVAGKRKAQPSGDPNESPTKKKKIAAGATPGRESGSNTQIEEKYFADYQNEGWMKNYLDLKSFVKREGHSIVSSTEKLQCLARWTKRQVRLPQS
jgi:hypothetical protein